MARIFRSFPVYRPLSRPVLTGGSTRFGVLVVQTRIRPRPTMAIFQQLPVIPAVAQPPIGKAVLHFTQSRRGRPVMAIFHQPAPSSQPPIGRGYIYLSHTPARRRIAAHSNPRVNQTIISRRRRQAWIA